ncbi:NDMA-dependent alcohol dehydrogenase [Pseudonocardia nematodicida]|uniref:NDMA-dependent alcohol dehydrogenase n=1 Tax=Pseudonocardia nematodicida TaxID=1206997 RepID=A0ABV1K598_9PSEU
MSRGRITTKGALLRKPGTRSGWSVEEIGIDPPKAGEARIRLAASGLCHSDDHLDTGDVDLGGWAPVLGGHEGAGVVEEVGPDVTHFAPGDHVVMSFMPSCGRCAMCVKGYSTLCELGAGVLGGTAPDGTHRVFTADGEGVGCMSYLGTFAPYVCVPTNALVKIDPEVPLRSAALLGCGVPTGWGSSAYAADMEIGDIVVVIGTGGVGMNAVQGARHRGASVIVAVDPAEFKREQAPLFGATHTVASWDEAKTLVDGMTNGQGADRVIITMGVVPPEVMHPAQTMLRRGGTMVLTGVVPMGVKDIKMDLFDYVMCGKRLHGTLYGDTNARADIPLLARLYREGSLKLDELITRTYPLEDINQAFADMHAGKNLRGVIVYD